jgi:hypothetical protein
MEGRITFGVVVAAVALLLAGRSTNLVAQGTPESARPTEMPEAMTGLWEAPDGRGNLAVMEITLSTLFENVAGPNGQPVYEEIMGIGLFERDGQGYRLNYFASDDQSHGVHWNGHHLTANFNARADQPKLRIDLTWDETSTSWSGWFEHDGSREQMVLRRPTAAVSPTSPFAGTWVNRNGFGVMVYCMHIAQASDGTLTGWSDSMPKPGHGSAPRGQPQPNRMRGRNGVLADVHGRYGELGTIHAIGNDEIAVQLRAFQILPEGIKPYGFTVRTSTVGNLLNNAASTDTWSRMTGESCFAGDRLTGK